MDFRPCIDIHNGKVKQIIGGTLRDESDSVTENFSSDRDAAYFANLYKENHITGGHIILLNKEGTEFFEATKKQALHALTEYPGHLQIGGGINSENALFYINAGASHVIVTSYVFSGGEICFEKLNGLVKKVSRKRIVLDLSCKRVGEVYYIMTDRWQKQTNTILTCSTLSKLSESCDEFLIHAVDVEGKQGGVDEKLLRMLAEFEQIPVTYAGGVHTMQDIQRVREIGKNRINITVGSALDLFGGNLSFREINNYCRVE